MVLINASRVPNSDAHSASSIRKIIAGKSFSRCARRFYKHSTRKILGDRGFYRCVTLCIIGL
jgi:hypothetical protein